MSKSYEVAVGVSLRGGGGEGDDGGGAEAVWAVAHDGGGAVAVSSGGLALAVATAAHNRG
jgi:hypothetical protein